jgi:NAD(P)-dependent dehydrogenase (short-subunit alcohol dehydrogenase family)
LEDVLAAKSIFITGAASGIGREVAVLFHSNGRRVAGVLPAPDR